MLKGRTPLDETYLYIHIPKELLSILNENTHIMYIIRIRRDSIIYKVKTIRPLS